MQKMKTIQKKGRQYHTNLTKGNKRTQDIRMTLNNFKFWDGEDLEKFIK